MEQNIVQVGSRQLDHKRDSPPKKHRPREIQQAKLHEFYNQQSCLPIL